MTKRRPILLVVADPVFGASVATLLETSGHYSVTQVGSALRGEETLVDGTGDFEAVLLDVNLPDEDGVTLCARLRSHDFMLPIVLLTGSQDESLLVRGFHVGADDVVRAPFSGAELLARLQARIRAFDASRDAAITIGRFVFHPGKRLLFDSERNSRVPLADKEARLLWHLHHAHGDIVSRLSLLHAIWGYSRKATTHTVETHIYRLRQKVEIEPARPTMILTERGGYRLALPGMKPHPAPLPVMAANGVRMPMPNPAGLRQLRQASA